MWRRQVGRHQRGTPATHPCRTPPLESLMSRVRSGSPKPSLPPLRDEVRSNLKLTHAHQLMSSLNTHSPITSACTLVGLCSPSAYPCAAQVAAIRLRIPARALTHSLRARVRINVTGDQRSRSDNLREPKRPSIELFSISCTAAIWGGTEPPLNLSSPPARGERAGNRRRGRGRGHNLHM